MNFRFPKVGLPILIMLTVLAGCEKDEKFADEPFLEWRDFSVSDQGSGRRSLNLQAYFTDGNGNIGRRADNNSPYDTCSAASYNFLIRYFEQVNGTFKEIEPETTTGRGCQLFHVILPDLEPEGQNKTLEGDIFVDFEYSGFPRNATDSIRFELQLRDRAGNLSNVASSPTLFIPEP